MNKQIGVDEHSAGERFAHFIDWLNHKLMPAIGPPDVGPYNAIVARVGEALCPVCDRPMAEHTIDHSISNAILNCPVEHKSVLVDEKKLNELGMPKRVR
jgi:hypothetical protein